MANVFEEKLKSFMEALGIQGKHCVFSQSCHSVAEAAAAVGGGPEDLVKNVCLVDEDSRFIVAIVKGEDRASTSRVAQALGARKVRTAFPAEVLERTGYPAGGTPLFGYEAIFLIDSKVMEKGKGLHRRRLGKRSGAHRPRGASAGQPGPNCADTKMIQGYQI